MPPQLNTEQECYFKKSLSHVLVQEEFAFATVACHCRWHLMICLKNLLCDAEQHLWKFHHRAPQNICHIIQYADYGHTIDKFLILCRPNSNPNPKWIFGMWIHGQKLTIWCGTAFVKWNIFERFVILFRIQIFYLNKILDPLSKRDTSVIGLWYEHPLNRPLHLM